MEAQRQSPHFQSAPGDPFFRFWCQSNPNDGSTDGAKDRPERIAWRCEDLIEGDVALTADQLADKEGSESELRDLRIQIEKPESHTRPAGEISRFKWSYDSIIGICHARENGTKILPGGNREPRKSKKEESMSGSLVGAKRDIAAPTSASHESTGALSVPVEPPSSKAPSKNSFKSDG